MRKFSWLAVIGVFGACGSQAPKYLEDLKTPALVWTQGTSLCSKIVAVDGDRVVWTDQGCENGRPTLDKVRTATETQVADLWVKFEALPLGQYVTPDTCISLLIDSFERWDSLSPQGASACGGRQYDDIGGLPDAFRALAQALLDLE
jgi:hypothetical protein